MGKWLGAENPANLGTKGLRRDAMDSRLQTLGLADAHGRVAAVPELKDAAGENLMVLLCIVYRLCCMYSFEIRSCGGAPASLCS